MTRDDIIRAIVEAVAQLQIAHSRANELGDRELAGEIYRSAIAVNSALARAVVDRSAKEVA